MRVFLDTSVLLSGCGSGKGASRYVCVSAKDCEWDLMTSGYCQNECLRNLPKLGDSAITAWEQIIEPCLSVVPDVVSLDKALAFEKTKDRPVVISALATRAEVLLTLDRVDFHATLGTQVYGMALRTPAEFLMEQRRLGRI